MSLKIFVIILIDFQHNYSHINSSFQNIFTYILTYIIDMQSYMEVKVWEKHSPPPPGAASPSLDQAVSTLYISAHLHFLGPAKAAVEKINECVWLMGGLVGGGPCFLYSEFMGVGSILSLGNATLNCRMPEITLTPSSVRAPESWFSPTGCGSQRHSWWRGEPRCPLQGISELPALLEFKNLLLHLPFSDISA